MATLQNFEVMSDKLCDLILVDVHKSAALICIITATLSVLLLAFGGSRECCPELLI